LKFSNLISLQVLGYLFIALICSVFIYQAIDFVPHDFANYYFGAKFLRIENFNSSIYFPHIFNQEIAALGYKNIFVSYAPNTPFLAIFYYPFTFFSLAIAKFIFNVLSLGLFLYSLRNLIKTYQIKSIFLFLIPLVFFIPLRNNFLFGQVYLLLFFLLSEGFLAYKKERFLRMGIFWGIAILLKVFPIILVGMLLFKKKFKPLFFLGLVSVFLLLFSIFINGFEVWDFFFNTVLPKSGKGEIAGEFVQNYQSMFMFLKYAFPTNTVGFLMVLLFFKLILLTLSYFITINESSQLKVFSFWIFVSILLSPYGSTYSNLVLIFPLMFFIKEGTINFKNLLILLLFTGITFLPVLYFSKFNIPFSFPRLLLMLLLFFFFINENLLKINWRKSTVFIAPILITYFFFFIPKEETATRQILSRNHVLAYNYTVKDGVLHYNYWNNNGENNQATSLQIKSIDTMNISLINNHIFYKNKQLTFGKDYKLKPAVINENQLLYLSDAKKGIGFYSLVITPLDINNESE